LCYNGSLSANFLHFVLVLDFKTNYSGRSGADPAVDWSKMLPTRWAPTAACYSYLQAANSASDSATFIYSVLVGQSPCSS
jgi:hypothetical protein